MCIVTNIHGPPAKEKLHDKHGNPQKLITDKDYSWHMNYIDKGDRMTNSYLLVGEHGSDGQKQYASPAGPHYAE
jgi:hypothetical protein